MIDRVFEVQSIHFNQLRFWIASFDSIRMSYLYSLPTTGAIKFTNLVSDPTNAHVSDLARATNARNRVRAVLKETRRAEGQNKDWMACANVRLNDLRESCKAVLVRSKRREAEADRAGQRCFSMLLNRPYKTTCHICWLSCDVRRLMDYFSRVFQVSSRAVLLRSLHHSLLMHVVYSI